MSDPPNPSTHELLCQSEFHHYDEGPEKIDLTWKKQMYTGLQVQRAEFRVCRLHYFSMCNDAEQQSRNTRETRLLITYVLMARKQKE